MSLLLFDDFRKRYGPKLILSIQEMSWEPGIHAVLGANGSGKSTLLKVLGGLIPHEGKIYLEDQIELARQVRKHRELINYCEAEPVFPDFLRGNYLIDLYVKYKSASHEQVSQLKEALGITDYPTHKISTYSSGMKKKLALLLAFLGTPSLILLDEPFATLDRQAREGLVKLILSSRERGVSFVLTSHQAFHPSLRIDQFWHISQQELHPGKPTL
ncbi:MAG: ATP-binding cassette domain-containing protein [Bacteroidota bacterium]